MVVGNELFGAVPPPSTLESGSHLVIPAQYSSASASFFQIIVNIIPFPTCPEIKCCIYFISSSMCITENVHHFKKKTLLSIVLFRIRIVCVLEAQDRHKHSWKFSTRTTMFFVRVGGSWSLVTFAGIWWWGCGVWMYCKSFLNLLVFFVHFFKKVAVLLGVLGVYVPCICIICSSLCFL